MDYFFGDGVGEPTQWQAEPDLTLGTGAADAIWIDFDGDGYADDAMWDSDIDGTADRVVTDVHAGDQAVYADEGGRGVWNAYAGGAGALAAGSVGGGSVGGGSVGVGSIGAGSIGGGSIGGGSIGGGSVGAGSVGAGSLAAGSIGAGAVAAGSEAGGDLVGGALAAGSAALDAMPDWGSLLTDAVVPVCAATNPLAGRELAVSDLRNVPLALRETGSGTLAVLEEALAGQGVSLAELPVRVRLGGTEALKNFVRVEDTCLAFLPRQAVVKELASGELAEVKIKSLHLQRKFNFIQRKGTENNGPYRDFLRFTQRHYAARE